MLLVNKNYQKNKQKTLLWWEHFKERTRKTLWMRSAVKPSQWLHPFWEHLLVRVSNLSPPSELAWLFFSPFSSLESLLCPLRSSSLVSCNILSTTMKFSVSGMDIFLVGQSQAPVQMHFAWHEMMLQHLVYFLLDTHCVMTHISADVTNTYRS